NFVRGKGLSQVKDVLLQADERRKKALEYQRAIEAQMEEKRRKQHEEHQRRILEEQEEEKRLAQERARLQEQYEEEQKKIKMKEVEIGKAIRSLVQLKGLLSLWRGLGPTILRDVPFSSIYWASYEHLKFRFQMEQPGFWFSFTAGGTAGTVAAVLTLPFDVVKTHRQIELGEMDIHT
ncbi:solute carrier family 25 member 39-like, partial [Limulus polyphemus]|uniref:Solute carrier family 25 member 39-like n=1 Tax=Limulus polyphemus TaxID=6850 RepID=A0ABM1RZV0_LIMPO